MSFFLYSVTGLREKIKQLLHHHGNGYEQVVALI